ncbi:MAG TPA: VOC family protein [Thermoplasmata archaeon]
MADPIPKTGTIVHVEVHTKDVAKAKKFYGDVFGWKFQDIPQMNYTTFEAPDRPNGGIQTPSDKMGPMVMNYIYANDIKRVTKKIENSGGTILTPVSEIPGFGWFAIFRGPGGEVAGVYEDFPKQ